MTVCCYCSLRELLLYTPEINMESLQNPQNINDPDVSLLDMFLKECNLLYKRGIYVFVGIADSKQSTHEMSYAIH